MSSEGVGLSVSDPRLGSSAPLTPRERARLANILARLASPFESERAAAGLLATEFMNRHGLTWSQLTGVMQTPPSRSPGSVTKDRRRGLSRIWQGYCRRQAPPAGHKISRLA